jgi:hypothetical protein
LGSTLVPSECGASIPGGSKPRKSDGLVGTTVAELPRRTCEPFAIARQNAAVNVELGDKREH